MDETSLQDMSVEELAAAREHASDDEKAAIDAELARRQQDEGGDEDEDAGDEGGDSRMKSEGSPGDAPMGATVLSGAYSALGTASADIQQAAQAVEQPAVGEALSQLVEAIDGLRSQLQDVYTQNYPDAPPLEGEEVQATTDAEVLKSFLAMGRDRQYRAKGIVSRLQILAKDLEPAHRARLQAVTKSLGSMLSEATSKQGGGLDEFKKEVGELQNLVKTLRR